MLWHDQMFNYLTSKRDQDKIILKKNQDIVKQRRDVNKETSVRGLLVDPMSNSLNWNQ